MPTCGSSTRRWSRSTADAVALDRTAFYPGGGGQPADTGQLGDTRVTQVFKDEHGLVWHVVDDPTASARPHEGRSTGTAGTC